MPNALCTRINLQDELQALFDRFQNNGIETSFLLKRWSQVAPGAMLHFIRQQPAAAQWQIIKESDLSGLLSQSRQEVLELVLSNAPDIKDGILELVWAHESPEKAAEWLLQYDQKSEFQEAWVTLATEVMQDMPEEAIKLVERIEDPEQKQKALYEIIDSASPKQGLQWVERIEDPESRAVLVDELYFNWLRNNEREARAALKVSGLSPKRQAAILNFSSGKKN